MRPVVALLFGCLVCIVFGSVAQKLSQEENEAVSTKKDEEFVLVNSAVISLTKLMESLEDFKLGRMSRNGFSTSDLAPSSPPTPAVTEAPVPGPVTETPNPGPVTEAPNPGSITPAPSPFLVLPTIAPSVAPSPAPVTLAPTAKPMKTAKPSIPPSEKPSIRPTFRPSVAPSEKPSPLPTARPTFFFTPPPTFFFTPPPTFGAETQPPTASTSTAVKSKRVEEENREGLKINENQQAGEKRLLRSKAI